MIQESRITAMFLIFERDGAQWRESYRVRTRGLPGFVLGSTTCTLNADGRIAAIGNAASNGEAGGTAYVLVRTGSAWDLRAELFSGDAPGGQRGFGSINGISADGSIVIVGNFDRWLRFRSDNSWASWSREVMGPTGVGASLGWSTTTWEIPCRLSPDGNEFYDVFNGHVFRRSGAAWRLITTWPKDIRFSDNGTRGMVCADVPGLQSLTARCMQYQRSGDSLNTIGTVDIVVHAGPIDYHDPLVDYFGNTVVFDDGTFVLGSFHPDEHWWLFESDGQRFREIETGLPRNRLLMQSAQDGHMLVVNAPYTTVTYARD